MAEFQKPCNCEYYAPSSESFKIYEDSTSSADMIVFGLYSEPVATSSQLQNLRFLFILISFF
jgi:hypothetical protein